MTNSVTQPETNNTLTMAREQLMEDIDCIIEGFYFDDPSEFARGDDRLQLTATDRDELIRTLCDAVCKNFPIQEGVDPYNLSGRDPTQSVWKDGKRPSPDYYEIINGKMNDPYVASSSLKWKLGIHLSEWKASRDLAKRLNKDPCADAAYLQGIKDLLNDFLLSL